METLSRYHRPASPTHQNPAHAHASTRFATGPRFRLRSGALSAVGWGEAAFLGLIQGLTEFLPVSSSAHLRIIGPMLPSGGDPGAAFTAITQIGTEAVVLLNFRRDLAAFARRGGGRWPAAGGIAMPTRA